MKSPVIQTAVCVALVAVALTLTPGCDNPDGNDWQRLMADVASVNEGAPLVSAYVAAGADRVVGTEDDYHPIDSAEVVFHARPYGSAMMITEDGAYSWFQIDSYDLRWENNPAVAVDLTAFDITDGNVDVMVPVHEEAGASVLIVGMDMKNAPWFVDISTGALAPFQANAHLTFYGHESGSSEEVAIQAGCRVHFIGAILEDG